MQRASDVVTGIRTALSDSASTPKESQGLRVKQRQARTEWYNGFLQRLSIWRRVTIPDEIVLGWMEYLHSVDYSHEQTTKAELWCQFGDWSKQSVDRTLDTQFVFFPTPIQVTEAITNARQSGLVVMTAQQAQDAFNRARVDASTLERLKRNSVDAGGQIGVSPTAEQLEKLRQEFESKYGRLNEE